MKKPSYTAIFAVAITAILSVFVLASCGGNAVVVQFDSNGGSSVEAVTLDGSELQLPLPTKENSRFAGWFFDNGTFENRVGANALFDGSIDQDTTLYAKWEASIYTVTFYADGEEYQRVFVEHGNTAAKPASPEKEGCRFDGWYRDTALTTPFDFTAPVTADASVYGAFVKYVVVSFDANGGSSVDPLTLDGTELTLPATVREGFDFKGWFFDNNTFENRAGANALFDGSIDQNTTLYAKWEVSAYLVTYYADGAEAAAQSVQKGGLIAEAAYPVKPGYQFDGWYQDEALRIPFDFTAPVTSDVSVYGGFLMETDPSLLDFRSAKDYVGFDSYLINGAASGATLPDDLVFPSSYNNLPVVIVMNRAFQNALNLKSVYIPDSVTIVGSSVFSGCAALHKVRMSRYLTEVGDNPFGNTALYNDAPNGYFYVGNVLCDYKGAIPEKLEVVVRDGTRVIANRVFWTSKNVVKVTLPSSLVYVGFNAFLQNPITEYVLAGESEVYAVKDGALFSKDLTHLVYYPSGHERVSYTVPSTVKSIGDESFVQLRFLQKLIIPDSVETLGDGVFDMSESLIEVEFGAGIRAVGDGVFHSQRALKRIIVKSPTPFPYGVYFLSGSGTPNYEIYIADASIDAYRTAKNWSAFASRMKPLSEYSF